MSVLTFSRLVHDARVLRQAHYLSRQCDVTVLAYADAGDEAALGERVRLVPLERPPAPGNLARARVFCTLVAGRAGLPSAYERLYWAYPLYRSAVAQLRSQPSELIVANDWNALPAAIRAASNIHAPVVADLHEYAPRQWDNSLLWRQLRGPMVETLLARYLPEAAVVTTVNGSLARAYGKAYGVAPLVILNTPAPVDLGPFRPCSPSRVRVVHHGAAGRARRLERMAQAIALADKRFTLDFMLVDSDPEYVRELKVLASRLAPDRIGFVPAVAPDLIVTTLTSYDVGMFVLPPTTYNYAHALPNKLFDFINAGLAVLVGPTPEMARVVSEHGCGVVADSFTPARVARTLDELTAESINAMKLRSRRAAGTLNADVELAKLLDLVNRQLEQSR